MCVRKFLHLYDFLPPYLYDHLHRNLYDSEFLPTNEHVPYCYYFAKRLHFHGSQKSDYRPKHVKLYFRLHLHTNGSSRSYVIMSIR